MTTIADLKNINIFRDLNDSELESLLSFSKVEKYDSGKRIFAEKSNATNLYGVLEGRVEIRMSGQTGKGEIVTDSARPGQIFGWSAVTEPNTFTAAAWTTEPTRLISINGQYLKNLFKTNNHVGFRVMMQISFVISKRLRQMRKNLAECMQSEK
ncbi:MAG: Crp/Fnr family transcriptional regulator [Candidatus Aminicenantes bacterium]|nr:Crp/Fnr family transcriptional regulator [Candidatus Aminicenantes bacterium]